MPETYLLNKQVLMITCVWLFISATLRYVSASSAFTLLAVIAGNLAAVAAWASAGMLSEADSSYAILGLWMFTIGSVTLWPRLRLNAREEEHARQFGRVRARTRDSWAILTGALLMLGIGLTLMAWYAADLYSLKLLNDNNDPTTRAAAFIVNGVALQIISHIFGRKRTVVRSRLAELIRWISPSHFLASLWIIQINAENGPWFIWLIILVLASISLCYFSVYKQWRPFLLTGLFYIAVAYVRCFMEAYNRLGDDPQPFDIMRLLLAGGMLTLGVLTMTIAWRMPRWIATLKLNRLSRNA